MYGCNPPNLSNPRNANPMLWLDKSTNTSGQTSYGWVMWNGFAGVLSVAKHHDPNCGPDQVEWQSHWDQATMTNPSAGTFRFAQFTPIADCSCAGGSSTSQSSTSTTPSSSTSQSSASTDQSSSSQAAPPPPSSSSTTPSSSTSQSSTSTTPSSSIN